MKKIDAETNILTWFEIPVIDSARAKKFYETILDIQMQTVFMEETGEELTFFPFNPGVIQATSGRVTGVLAKSIRSKPSTGGTRVYINASPEIEAVLNRVDNAGGKIIEPKILIRAGYIAVIEDTEGNYIGLHAEK